MLKCIEIQKYISNDKNVEIKFGVHDAFQII